MGGMARAIVLNIIGLSFLAIPSQGTKQEPQQALTASMLQKEMIHGERKRHGFQQEGEKRQEQNARQVVPKTGFYAVCCFAIVALTWEIYSLYEKKKTENARDRRWDAAKFVFMALVVACHIEGYGFEQWKSPSQHFMSRIHMPGFSFVSGVFAAGSALVEPGQRLTLQFKKLEGLVCDLLLNSVTIIPVLALWSESGIFSYFSKTPLVGPAFWYLACLFLWQLTVPCLCIARNPILLGFAISVFVGWGEITENGITLTRLSTHYVFFVVGFALAGGGLAAEKRGAKRKALEDSLGNRNMLWPSIAVLLLAMAMMSQDAWRTPWQEVFQQSYLHGEAFSWESYGPLTQAAHIGWTFVIIFAALAIIFAIPIPQMIGDAGSRTLFVYVLHSFYWGQMCGEDMKNLPDIGRFALMVPVQLRAIMGSITIAVLVTLVLGSSLTETLTSPLVRPRWLLKLLIRSDSEEVKAEKK